MTINTEGHRPLHSGIVSLSNGWTLLLQWGSVPAPGCAACIDYTLYDKNSEDIDGGQLDFKVLPEGCVCHYIEQVLEFAFLDRPETTPTPKAIVAMN